MEETTITLIRLIIAVMNGDADGVMDKAKGLVPEHDWESFEKIIRGAMKGSR